MHPLLIPEVLDEVFSYLYPATLKECRLVHKVWNTWAPLSPNWTKYYVIHYNESEDDQLLLEEERISISDETIARKVLFRPKQVYRPGSNYVLAPEILRKTTTLALETYQNFAPKLVDILTKLKDSLTQLSIKQMDGEPPCDSPHQTGLAELFQIFPSLRKLSYSNEQCFSSRELFPLRNLIKEVILNSPELEEMEIRDNIFPNFENCEKLRTIRFHCHTGPKATERFSIPEFLRVLDQVKDRIETLELGDSSMYSEGIPYVELKYLLKLPKFKKVKTLSIAVDLYLLNPSVSLIQSFPLLRNLKLFVRFTGPAQIDNFVVMESRKTEEVMGTLECLEIHGDPKLETIQTISRIFPNLKKLTCHHVETCFWNRVENTRKFLGVCLRSVFFEWRNLEGAKFVMRWGGCVLTILSAVKSLSKDLSGRGMTIEIEFFPGSCSHKDEKDKFDKSDEELTQNFSLFKDTDIKISGISECAELPGFLQFVQENGLRILIKPNA